MEDDDFRPHLFETLRELADAMPHMRGGQPMAAAGERCRDLHGRGLRDASDAELPEAVWQFHRSCDAAGGTSIG